MNDHKEYQNFIDGFWSQVIPSKENVTMAFAAISAHQEKVRAAALSGANQVERSKMVGQADDALIASMQSLLDFETEAPSSEPA